MAQELVPTKDRHRRRLRKNVAPEMAVGGKEVYLGGRVLAEAAFQARKEPCSS